MLSFAIVVPNLNQSHFLWSALESLRHQSSPFNLALMDGGSTDNFQEVIGPYSDIISFLRSEPDAGQAAAIREGKDKIEGEIVAWLNADDYYFPNALDKVVSCFEQDPHVDVIYGDAVHVSPEGFFKSYFPAIQEFNQKELTRSNFICQPACFVRRSAYERAGKIDPTLHYSMDWDLWCRLALSGAKFRYIREVLAAVRYYPEMKTLSGTRKRYLEIYRVEKTYGKNLLPLSWFKYYYFDIKLKGTKTKIEGACFLVLRLLRRLKKILIHFTNRKYITSETNYGFHCSEPIVFRRGIIYLPWYSKRQWKRLYLQVRPVSDPYEIAINKQTCSYVTSSNGYLSVEVPLLSSSYREISIKNLKRKKWKFYDSWIDLK